MLFWSFCRFCRFAHKPNRQAILFMCRCEFCCTKQPIKCTRIYVVALKHFNRFIEIILSGEKERSALPLLLPRTYFRVASITFFSLLYISFELECLKFKVIALVATCILRCPHMCNWNWLKMVTCCGYASARARALNPRESQTRSYCNIKSIYYWSPQIFQINWLVDTFLWLYFFWSRQCCAHTECVFYQTNGKLKHRKSCSICFIFFSLARAISSYDLCQCDYDSDANKLQSMTRYSI